MVIHAHAKHLFSTLLPDDILVKVRFKLFWRDIFEFNAWFLRLQSHFTLAKKRLISVFRAIFANKSVLILGSE